MTRARARSWFSCTRSEVDLFVRLGVLYALMAGFQYVIASQSLLPFFGHPSFVIDEWSLFPRVLPALLLGLVFAYLRRDLRDQELGIPPATQATVALVALIVVSYVVGSALHPTDATVQRIVQWPVGDLSIRLFFAASLAMLSYTVLLLPAAFCLFATRFLFRYAGVFGAAWLVFAGYLMSGVVNELYFRVTGPWLIRMTQFAIQTLLGEQGVGNSRLEATYNGFSVRIGPACSDLAAIFLLLCVLGYVWLKGRPRTAPQAVCAVLCTLTAGLGVVALNVARIVSIMVVGSYWRSFALGLFHSSVGGFILFLYILAATIIATRIVARWRASDQTAMRT